ncbi:DUF4159 domain-containing protein [Paracoccus xiamenensis]|uniref:DUF4159 domain-containing protein n=1 Tax=Paracoccus xiamenensis TaxID=2714901 RepID=UPI00140AFE86|nr:DUF4159 domain-containing protein [Paracoccus xiamenensis]NHF72303.1 DUF4159 domain-containing protein [Paracoccus xiamenensis]
MMMLGPIGFGAPLVLLALATLPLLWWLLRALPPVPKRIRFPGTALLAGLQDPNPVARRTPWWLLLLRLMAVAAAILAFSAPVWRPAPPPVEGEALLIVMDAGATAAPGWRAAQIRALRAAEGAIAGGHPVAVLLADGRSEGALPFGADDGVAALLRAAAPQAWPGAYPDAPEDLLANAPEDGLRTLWLSDGLDHPGRAEWLAALSARGPVGVVSPAVAPQMLRMARDGAQPELQLQSTTNEAETGAGAILALGPDPQGIPRELARLTPGAPTTRDGITSRPVPVDLPPELLGRVTRFQIEGVESAAAVVLGDDRLRRPVVALIGQGQARSEGQALLSPAHFLRSALDGSARVIEAGLDDALAAQPDVIVLMDRSGLEADGPLADWVTAGGLLIRFAGPRMAADPQLANEPLLPVRLRPGGRDMGGALSWGDPRPIAPFAADGPFAGLSVPGDVTIRAQLMAEPAPDLAARSIATLTDGTPLVTRAPLGEGRVVLFHSTANADWSSLPISGLFVQMLERLIAGAGRAAGPAQELPQGGIWTATQVLDGFGRLSPAESPVPVETEVLAQGAAPDLPAGIYASGERILALNAGLPMVAADWPGATVETDSQPGIPLAGWLLLAAATALLADLLGSAALRRGRLAAVLIAALALTLPPETPRAQEIDPELARAASEFAMGYVLTGDAELDEISRAGLEGLSLTLMARTTVEPTPPVAIDLETADLTLMSFLYWPIGPDQPVPTAEAYLRLNRFLRGGGMILFDTRDADLAGSGADGAEDLRRLAGPLDMPPLQLVPRDHVLTRSFYLLDDLPGRFSDGDVWVETATAEAGTVNDGVSPVVIGGNAWAEAWATDDRGLPLFAVGAGLDGERQRELAHRFGVNLIMYVLTGNYKSDQIHVPALLERLRQEEAQ